MVTVERKKEAVVFLQTKEVSERRSCQLILLARSTCGYRLKRTPDEEFVLRQTIQMNSQNLQNRGGGNFCRRRGVGFRFWKPLGRRTSRRV